MQRSSLTASLIAAAFVALVPIAASAASKPVVAVLTLVDQNVNAWWGAGFEPGDAFSSLLTNALVNAGQVDVVDRTHLDSVLKEQQFASSNQAAPETDVQVGRVVGAQYFVVGRVVQLDHAKTNTVALGKYLPPQLGGVSGQQESVIFRVTVRVVDVSTGRVVQAIDEARTERGTSFAIGAADTSYGGAGAIYTSEQFKESSMGKALAGAAAEVAGKIDSTHLVAAAQLPKIQAKIAAIIDKDVIINAGSARGVQRGMFFTVYELHTVTDPDTGKPLTVKSKKGVIQVVSVDEKSSTANVVSGTVKELELVESE